MTGRWLAIGQWVAVETDGCTCGTSGEIARLYGHEPHCGLEPVEPCESEGEAERLALMANLSGGVPA